MATYYFLPKLITQRSKLKASSGGGSGGTGVETVVTTGSGLSVSKTSNGYRVSLDTATVNKLKNRYYTFEATIQDTEFTIYHNLDSDNLIVSVYEINDQDIKLMTISNCIIVDKNNIVVKHDRPVKSFVVIENANTVE